MALDLGRIAPVLSPAVPPIPGTVPAPGATAGGPGAVSPVKIDPLVALGLTLANAGGARPVGSGLGLGQATTSALDTAQQMANSQTYNKVQAAALEAQLQKAEAERAETKRKVEKEETTRARAIEMARTLGQPIALAEADPEGFIKRATERALPDKTANEKDFQRAMENPNFKDFLLEMKKSGASKTTIQNIQPGVNMHVAGEGGALGGSLDQHLPPGTVYTSEGKIVHKPPSVGGEESVRLAKFQNIRNIADSFHAKALEFEKRGAPTGPLQGHIGRVTAGHGLAPADQAELVQLEAGMMTQLGTALSGAAIPKTEWPKYERQIPSVTDSPEIRERKIRNLPTLFDDLAEEAEHIRQTGRTRSGMEAARPSDSVPLTPENVGGVSTEDLFKRLTK